MKLNPDDLEKSGYKPDVTLRHNDIVPFIRTYINKRTPSSSFYISANLIILVMVVILFFFGREKQGLSIGDGFYRLSYGIVLAFCLIPVHELLHALAYKIKGAPHVSFDYNLKKFYFMALADRFVVNEREFRFVALAPFIVITLSVTLLLPFTSDAWTFTLMGTLLTHTAFCSGDFGLLSYFDANRGKEIVTYDDKNAGCSFFYLKDV